ncbi:glucosaminidase domain-containing protein [Parendozoicomonas sp. Alg238-R29]|uniref:glucosaminidase domain-containing protein n=1 Tax=Parendozoicomonas sp. Alg238-R29 TaxID=2993446 RepID=UPI00248E385F|nr:glucosaminidase domain-containing protein [Parendozoicomonas sp. Alg238-R29]
MIRFSVDFTLTAVLAVLLGVSLVLDKETDREEVSTPIAEKLVTKQAWELAGVPDFTAINDVKQKKQTFFSYILPMVEQENKEILAHRARLVALSHKEELAAEDKIWLSRIGGDYRLGNKLDSVWFAEMLLRVDVIPPSLALAQAANESGWGTSRFAREGNNYFGQWCFLKGCGLVPNSRTEGFTHEVRKFDDVNGSVRAYIKNLNTHAQYQSLRELRANARFNGMTITGAYIAQGLGKYSERGSVYVDEIVQMIHGNRLARFDKTIDVVREG